MQAIEGQINRTGLESLHANKDQKRQKSKIELAPAMVRAAAGRDIAGAVSHLFFFSEVPPWLAVSSEKRGLVFMG